jgi:hypothetical protein
VAGCCEHSNEQSGSIEGGDFLTSSESVSFSRRTFHHGASCREVSFSGLPSFMYKQKIVHIFIECEDMVNGDMASVSGNMHTEQVAAPDTSMLLRERIKRLMGNGIYASWKSLSEVKSSGLLGKITISHT